MSNSGKSVWGILAGMLLLVVMVSAGWTGWQWMQQVTVQEIRIRGQVNTTEAEILELMRTDTGAVMFEVNAVMIEDRVVRHPWIHRVDVARLPSGVLDLQVTERVPVALLMDGEGRPAWWVDAFGWRLPITDQAQYDVPLLFAPMEPWHPMRPLEQTSTRELLSAIGSASQRLDALFSEFVYQGGEWELRLTPVAPHGGIRVQFGASGFARDFDRLLAFWDQQVLQHQNKIYDRIDLRFDSQIIVEERSRPERSTE
ncbi:MAG: FtsQ-type POTRA domain-containing protein [Bacteroidetes bacterium]|nr:FtsQ-type POTRA domain-containing protein [Bacteroidota bacterium]